MISPVSSFFPAIISNRLPSVQQSAASSSQASFKPAASGNLPATLTRSSFADKLPITFSLSPSDFSDVFGSLGSDARFTQLLQQTASIAYTQSHVLTASRLSVQA